MSSPAQTLSSAQNGSSWAPTAKVSAGLLAASVTALLLPFFKKITGTDLNASDGAAITTVMTFLIQYIVPERESTPPK